MRIITALLGLSVCCSFEATAQGGYHGTEVTETDIANHVGQNIDTNHPVGATAGVADVSDIGSASYSIPIYVAPGTNGMQPQLSITYNSLAGDGVLGYGWTIGGLSSIRRVGRNVYSDNVCLPVQFNDLDRFEIDGQRLVLTSGGPYGADGSIYDTENAQFNFVSAHGQAEPGGGPTTFEQVLRESGMTREYAGGGIASTVYSGGSNAIYMWLLSKVKDAHGNYMTYTYANVYDNAAPQPILTRIDYTRNEQAGIAAYNSVEFEYVDRADANLAFVGPETFIRSAKLLSTITVYAEGTPFKKYQFNYCQRDHGKAYLREIVEVGANLTTTLNSTLVKYGDSSMEEWHDQATNTQITHDADYYSGNFMGTAVVSSWWPRS